MNIGKFPVKNIRNRVRQNIPSLLSFWDTSQNPLDPYLVQYLGYCTVCNTSNPNHPFNPMALYLDTSPVQVSNPCALLFSFYFPHFELQNSSLVSLTSTEFLSHFPNAPLSQPRLCLHHSLNIHACSLPLPQPRRHRFLHTQLRSINKNKEKMARTPFLDPDQRESKG